MKPPKLLLKIVFLIYSFSASAQVTKWQYLKKGQGVKFDSAVAIPVKEFRQQQRAMKLQDKTLLEQFNTMVELRETIKNREAQVTDLNRDISRVMVENKYHQNTIQQLQAQLAAKPGKRPKK